MQLIAKKSKKLAFLQLSGCINAVDDSSIIYIARLTNLTFLDISYCNRLTDNQASVFRETLPLDSLVMNGLGGVSSVFVTAILKSCAKTLLEFEGSNNDHLD